MTVDLQTLQLSDLTVLGADLRKLGFGAPRMETVAKRAAAFLYDELRGPSTTEHACVLVRFYRTMPFAQLPPDLQQFARQLAGTRDVLPETRCLTLLGTAGDDPAWCSRRASQGHQAIPLVSIDAVRSLPMVAHLLAQLGIDVGFVLRPDPGLLLELEQKSYNVFYVPEAAGSPFIPAQDTFVVPHKVRSVVGFGGLLPSGDVFAMLAFSRVEVARNTADMFRNMALNLKVALLPAVGQPIFED